MPTGWDSILTVISFGDCYTDGLEMLLGRKMAKGTKYISQKMFFPPSQEISFLTLKSRISLKK